MLKHSKGCWVGRNINLEFNKSGNKVKLIQNHKVLATMSTKSLVIKASVAAFSSSESEVILTYDNSKKKKKPIKKTIEFIPDIKDDQRKECLRCGEFVALDDLSLGICSYCSKVGDE